MPNPTRLRIVPKPVDSFVSKMVMNNIRTLKCWSEATNRLPCQKHHPCD